MPEKSIETDISSLNSLLHSIITIISIDPNSINLRGLRTLVRVTGKNGEIESYSINNQKYTGLLVENYPQIF